MQPLVIHYLRLVHLMPHYYGGKDGMKNYSRDLRKHVTKIINYEKKERNGTISK